MTVSGLKSVHELGADRPHGTRLRYMSGCKCFHCRRANSAYEMQRQRARLAGDWNGIVDAAPARAHIKKLARAGVGYGLVAEAANMNRGICLDIKQGRRLRARARTVRKILAVTTACRSDVATVCAASTWKLIHELLEEGYKKSQLAKMLGRQGQGLQIAKVRVHVKTRDRVERLHRKLTE